MAEKRQITNLSGVLYYLDIPLLDFSIQDKQLVRAINLSQTRFFPPELALYGISYGNLNEFFERRTMKENCMFYREHLRAIGMENFDFDLYLKKNNGNNHLDNYWVKFSGFGAACFADICEQEYPVYPDTDEQSNTDI